MNITLEDLIKEARHSRELREKNQNVEKPVVEEKKEVKTMKQMKK